MSDPFSIGLPLSQPTPVYTPTPIFNGGVQGTYPPAASLPIGTTDQYNGSANPMSQIIQPAAIGALAGYKAPRGIEHVRQKLNINQFGETVRRTGGRGRGGGGGGGGWANNNYDSRGGWGNNGQRGMRGMGRGGPSVGSRDYTPIYGRMAAIKSSVLWGSVMSVALNGYQYFNKQETGAQAGTNIVGDVASSAVSGTGAAMISWAGAGLLGTFGMTGMALSVCGIGIGIAGFFVCDQLLRQTGFFKSLQSGTYKLLGGA